MTYAQGVAALNAKRAQIEALREEMRAIQAAIEPEAVTDYVFAGWNGPVRLSELFYCQTRLPSEIHNMGTGCPACTMWADGFNGVYDHLADRAGFVVSSPNAVEVQKPFAAGRGWRFPMVSHAGTTFAKDMGYCRLGADPVADQMGGWYPGVSAFQKQGDRIVRVSDAELGEDDDFCAVWRLFDLLPEHAAGWVPKFRYA